MFKKNSILMIIIAITLSLPIKAKISCSRHPIYCQIKKNKPKINKKYAMTLSNIIYKVTHKYNIPPRIFTAILAQESGYSLKAKGCHRGLAKQEIKVYYTEHYWAPYTEYKKEKRYEMKEIKVCSDFGIGQIYFKTAKSFGFNINKLTTNLEYSVNAAAKVLSGFKKRYERREVMWWTRYNARNKIKRRIYKELVKRYF